MNALDKILEAQRILLEQLKTEISSFDVNKMGKELKVSLNNGILV